MKNKLPRNYLQKGGNLFFKQHSIKDLALSYGTPLRVNIPGIFEENYSYIKQIVQEELEAQDLQSEEFMCGYAMKANPHYRLVSRAVKVVDFIEASSLNDLCIVEFFKKELNNKMIVCHGFKPTGSHYYDKILELQKKGMTVIPVVDSLDELRGFLNANTNLNIGVRVTSETVRKNNIINERFGLTYKEITNCFDMLANSKNVNVCMLHMHVGNTIVDIDKRLDDLKPLIELYYRFQASGHDVQYINTGGGLPHRGYTGDKFYRDFFRGAIREIKAVMNGDVDFPILLNESGRFFAAESQFLVLKVLLEKKNNEKYSWYILNGSSINLIPELMLDLNIKFPILAANRLDKKIIPVICAGITCDPEDYFQNNIGNLPQFSEKEPLFVVIPCTGAYQESLLGSQRGYPGHCLVDNATDLTIEDDGNLKENVQKNNFLHDLGYPKM